MSMISPTISNVQTEVITSAIGVGASISYCSLMSWTDALTTNCAGVFSGNELTVTNDGGGGGNYLTAGDTKWRSTTGDISGEIKFISASASTSTHNIYIIQGTSTVVCALSYNVATQVLYDIVGTANVATGLTGGADYTFGIKLDQAAGTATFSDSEANSGSITASGSYDNTLPSLVATGGGTGVSEVAVHEVNIGTEAWWLAASSGAYCDYNNDMTIANYPFTSDLANTITPSQVLVSSVAPTPSASGIPLVAATDGKVVSTGFPVNDFQITFTVQFDESPAANAAICENEWTAGADLFLFYLKSGAIPEVLKGAAFTPVTLSTAGLVDGRTFNIAWVQSSTTGLSITMTEVGGSSYSQTGTNATAAGKADMPAWTGYATFAERTGGALQADMTIKDWDIEYL